MYYDFFLELIIFRVKYSFERFLHVCILNKSLAVGHFSFIGSRGREPEQHVFGPWEPESLDRRRSRLGKNQEPEPQRNDAALLP